MVLNVPALFRAQFGVATLIIPQTAGQSVSGEPPQGSRDLLDFACSEPGVDFEHEQMLRQPKKIRAGPQTFDRLVGRPAAAKRHALG